MIYFEEKELERIKTALFTRGYLEKLTQEENEDISQMATDILEACDKNYIKFEEKIRKELEDNVEVSEELVQEENKDIAE